MARLSFRVMRRAAAAVALMAAPLVPSPALAWGPAGHAIVADIAEARLSPTAREQVRQVLATEESTTLDQVASWGDDYRATHPETSPWHDVAIPLGNKEFSEKRDCARGDCVVTKIVAFARVLADKSAQPADRAQALKFLVELVADAQQPLHCADNADHDGEDVKISFYGAPMSFRAVWDEGIIGHETKLRTKMPGYRVDRAAARAVAQRLDGTITAAQAAQWAPKGLAEHLHDGAVGWANEAHLLAQSAYDAKGTSTRLGGAFDHDQWPVVQMQLERGGVRLAELLNEILQ
jgi:hypothetical protein